MTGATIQRFFETPLIQCELSDASAEGAVEATLKLAETFTIDVSQPAEPRFRWSHTVREISVEPGMRGEWQMSSGRFWVAYVSAANTSGGGGIAIEDPRAAMLAVGIRGLAVAREPVVEFVAAEPMVLTMLPGYVRHRLIAGESAHFQLIEVSLRADPIA